jgi:hypothetical protein
LTSPSPSTDGNLILFQDRGIHNKREVPASAEGTHSPDEIPSYFVNFVFGGEIDSLFLQYGGKGSEVHLAVTWAKDEDEFVRRSLHQERLDDLTERHI